MKKLILILILLLLLIPSIIYAACTGSSPTWTSTPDYTSVDSCVSGATAGDTINVTAGDGTEDWGTTLTVTKGVSLIGPGKTNLIIKNTIGASPLIYYNPSNYETNKNYTFRLSGFSLDGNGQTTLQIGAGDKTPPFTPNLIRVDNNKFFDSASTAGYHVQNRMTCYGVIHDNEFHNKSYATHHYSGSGNNNIAGPHASWWFPQDPVVNTDQSNFALGSEKYTYWEDNTFNDIQVMSGGAESCRYVFRYNTINVGITGAQIFDVHGYQGNYPDATMDSCFGAEIYGNTLASGAYSVNGFLYHRSGQALSFMNSSSDKTYRHQVYNTGFSNTISCPIYEPIDDKLIHNTYIWNNKQGANNWTTDCDGDHQLTASTISFSGRVITNSAGGLAIFTDDNVQITGSVSNDGFWHNYTQTANTITTDPTETPFTTEEAGASIKISGGMTCGSYTDIPKSGRDVFTDNMAGSPSSPGVSCGDALPLPWDCTVGEGYWVTSQDNCSSLTGYVGASHTSNISGTLYKCTETDTWTSFYTPYTYPHPLRGEEITGAIVWGHTSDVTEPDVRTFLSGWTCSVGGTACITSTGNTERIILSKAQYATSPIVSTGVKAVRLNKNKYRVGTSILFKYRTCAVSDCSDVPAFTIYSDVFNSLGYVQIRVEAP